MSTRDDERREARLAEEAYLRRRHGLTPVSGETRRVIGQASNPDDETHKIREREERARAARLGGNA